MNKELIAAITAISLTSSLISPALAGSGQDGISDAFASRTQARAGVFFRLPFTGGLKKSDLKEADKSFNYGLKLGWQHSFAGSSMVDSRHSFNVNMVKLNFNGEGFNNFQLSGQNIISYNNGKLGFLTNEDGSTNWNVMGPIMGGIVAVGLGIVLIKSGKCLEGEIKVDGKCVSPNPIE